MVRDLNLWTLDSEPEQLAYVGTTLFFVANDGSGGRELWKSDGTFDGTALVKDILPGILSSSPTSLTNVWGILYFVANDGTDGNELWKSDGTEQGTTQVKDINLGSGGAGTRYLTNVDGTLFFVAGDPLLGAELWKRDGSEEGTVNVADIYPGPTSSTPKYLTNVNGTLFFSALDGLSGRELWKSDGTGAGTIRIKNILPGSLPTASFSGPTRLTNVQGVLFFQANDGARGYELWKSDGTEVGTHLVRDVFPGIGSSFPGEMTHFNGSLFFSANDGANNRELWSSDGTEAGTVQFKDIRVGVHGSQPRSLVSVGSSLFFTADDGIHGEELWTSDGTEAGTIAEDINWDGLETTGVTQGFQYPGPSQLTNVNGTLFFQADDGTRGPELWVVAPSVSTEIVAAYVYHRGSGSDHSGNDFSAALDRSKKLAREEVIPKELTHENLINTSFGINGIVLEITHLPGVPGLSDFAFQMSPQGVFDELLHSPTEWTSAPSPSFLSLVPGEPSQIVIGWPDQSIVDRWLRITVFANPNTGISQPVVYYIGHLRGESTGLADEVFTVSFEDIPPIRTAIGNSVDVSDVRDIDKNGFITLADIAAMRSNVGAQLTQITVFSASESGATNSLGLPYFRNPNGPSSEMVQTKPTSLFSIFSLVCLLTTLQPTETVLDYHAQLAVETAISSQPLKPLAPTVSKPLSNASVTTRLPINLEDDVKIALTTKKQHSEDLPQWSDLVDSLLEKVSDDSPIFG